MKWILALFAIAFLSVAPFAEITHIGDVYPKDYAKWDNLSSPSDMWPNGDTLYVLDTDGNRIVEFYKGEPKKITPGNFDSPGGMLFPRAFWYSEDGRIYLANTGGNNVLVYENGNYLQGIAVPGSDTYSFDNPWGIAVDSGVIYVADTGRGTIKLFGARDKTYIGGISAKGFGETELTEPSGIDIWGGQIYIADKGNDRVQVFKLNGTHVMAIRGAYECVLSAPRGVSVNGDGSIFVSDTGNNRVVVFDKNGKCLDTINGSEKVALNGPTGIRVDSTNNVYVADSGNGRIQVFRFTPYYETSGAASKKISEAKAACESLVPLDSAASHLNILMPGEMDYLGIANTEFSKGNYSNAYSNASSANLQCIATNASLALRIQAEVLRIVLGDEQLLDIADQEASRYAITVDSGPIRAEIFRIRKLLDSGRYADAAFNATALHVRTLKFKSSISGSSNDTAKTRDDLLLAISDTKNELSGISLSASQYKLNFNYSAIMAMLETAKDSCSAYDFELCRARLSSAKTGINDARLLISAYAAKVEIAQSKISGAHQELSAVYSSAYFFKPDLSPAEKMLSDAEIIVAQDPGGASQKVDTALTFIEGAKAGINRTNLLAIIGVGAAVLLLVAVVVMYYVTRGKPRKRKGI
ncbi:MAG: NHL repeat-containing protein [Candidatus Micrarchaeota archaeon]